MFADNNRISRTQMERQYLLAYLGPLVLWIGPGLQGRYGFLSILAGALLLCIWIFFLLRQVHIFRYPGRYWGKVMSWVIALVYESYLLLTGAWLAANAGEILKEYIIQDMPHWLAAGLFVLIALGSSAGSQERGRFAQTAWPIAGGILALMLLLAAFQGQGGQGQQTQEILMIQEPPVWNSDSAGEIFKGIVWFLVSLLGTVLIPFLEMDYNGGREHSGFLMKMIGKITLWLCVISVLLQAVFGTRGTEMLEFPMLNLMAGVRIPGGFVRRIDMIFLTVTLFALLFSLGSIFFYSKYIFGNMGVHMGRIPAAAICFLLGTVDLGGWSLVEEYPKLIACIYLPVFLIMTVCNVILRRKKYGK